MPLLHFRERRSSCMDTQTLDGGETNTPTSAVSAPLISTTGISGDCMAAVLEYIGTTVFLTLAYGGVQASQGENNLSASTSSDIQRIIVTGGLFNPNVSLALVLTGIIGPLRFVLYCIAQLLGGITAAALVLALTPGPLASNTFLGPGINAAQGVFIEMFITSFLVIAVLMLAAEKHNTTPFAPVGIGLTSFVCHLWTIFYTGCGMNTARSFSPAVVTGFPYGTHWVYWVGPCLGSFLGAGFYAILKHFKYWQLNPGQDTVDSSQSPPNPLPNGRGEKCGSNNNSFHSVRTSGQTERGRSSDSPV